MKILIAQLNPVVGDFAGNLRKILEAIDKARAMGAELLLLPELSVCGYPPKDLLYDDDFLTDSATVVERVAESGEGIGIVVGFPERQYRDGRRMIYNSAALIDDGKITGIWRKQLLPTYDVFDEARYFVPGEGGGVFDFRGIRLGISICEDAWNDADLPLPRPYDRDPISDLAERGADLIVNIAASPFWLGKAGVRREMLCRHAERHGRWLVFVNQVGGNDELVFDGRSVVINPAGRVVHEVPPFMEEFSFVDLNLGAAGEVSADIPSMSDDEELFKALVLGTRDYVRKCGFSSCVLGLSGGIDSAVTAAIAVEALGPSNVTVVSMPSRYTSKESRDDAREVAARLGIAFKEIPIDDLFDSYLTSLKPVFEETEVGVAEENIQARIRGNILMALSNKFGHLCLSTGNKSEIAVGYCTLYGDMAGGLGVIADVLKTMVYRLASYINREREIIPSSIISKPPSAELREGQRDTDSLPPYEVLDPIIADYIERGVARSRLVDMGHDPEVVERVIDMIDRSEYKRRQMTVGLKVTPKAFGTGRRCPIAKVRTKPEV